MGYLTTGTEYLPEMDKTKTASYVTYSVLIVIATFLLGAVLMLVLPAIYK